MINPKNNELRTILIVGLAGSAAYFIGKSSFMVTPVILSSVMKGLDLSATNAGFLVTLEMLALALSSLVFASFVGKMSKRKMFIGGIFLLLLGQMFSSLTDVMMLVVISRITVGLGGGMIATVANATMSSSRDPERAFAVAFVVSGVIAAIVIPVLLGLSDQFAHAGVFSFLAVAALVFAPLCIPLFKDNKSGIIQPELPTTHPPLAYLTLLAMFAYLCVVGGVWAFAEQIAIQAGVEGGTIGMILSAATLAGLTGGFLASWLSTKIGRIKPIVVCAIVQILSVLVLTSATTTLEYSVSLLVVTTTFYFIMPYLIGVAAMFGENGRWGAAGGGASLLGLALSSGVGGLLVDLGGYKLIGIAFGISGPLSILLLTFVIIQHSKSNVSINAIAS